MMLSRAEAKASYGCEGVYWIHLAQERDQWRSIVYRTMNLRLL